MNQAIAIPNEKYQKLLHEVEELRQWKRRVLEIISIPNKVASPTARCVIIAAIEEVQQSKNQPDRDTRTTVFMPKIAKRAGVSAKVAGRALKRAKQIGAFDHEVYRPTDGNGKKARDSIRVAIAPTLAFLDKPLQAIHMEEKDERKHGGTRVKRVQCVHCGSENVLEVSHHVCVDCGREQPDSRHVKPVNPVVEEQEQEQEQEEVYEIEDSPELKRARARAHEQEQERHEPEMPAAAPLMSPTQDDEDDDWPPYVPPEPESDRVPAPAPARLPYTPPVSPWGLPVPLLAMPWACHCGIRMYWIERNGITHCTSCEIEYRERTSCSA